MFDPREYREVCRELRAPEKKIEEIIAMTEQRTHKRRFRALGTGLAVCAAAATMVVGWPPPTRRPRRNFLPTSPQS